MSYAVMKPLKVPVIDAIPPPAEYYDRIPPQLKQHRTKEQIQKAQEEFEERANQHYYAEWFWFPYSDNVWINTWETTDNGDGSEDYPSRTEIVSQWVQAVAMEGLQNLAQSTETEDWFPLVRTSLICK